MAINVSKTHSMRIHKMEIREERYIAPGGEEIVYIEEMKDLGVIMDQNESFKKQVTAVINRCFKVIW